jgi:hypothetical protein
MLIDASRVQLSSITGSLITLGSVLQGFRDAATFCTNNISYSWVIEANIDSSGIAHDREGGYGTFTTSGGNKLGRTTVWSTSAGNAQIAITGYSEVIITPLSSFGLPQGYATGHGDSDYTCLQTDGLVYANAFMSATRTWTLPPVALYGVGRDITIADYFGWVTVVAKIIIDGNGSELIDGALTYTLNNEYSSVTLRSNGTSWKVVDESSRAPEDILKTGSFSGVANIDISLTPYMAYGYKSFKLLFHKLVASNADVSAYGRFSTDAGATFAATGYLSNAKYASNTDLSADWAGTGSTAGMQGFINNAANNKTIMEINLFSNPNQSGYVMANMKQEAYYSSTGSGTTFIYLQYANMVWPTANDVDTFRLVVSAGTFAGTYTLLGVR